MTEIPVKSSHKGAGNHTRDSGTCQSVGGKPKTKIPPEVVYKNLGKHVAYLFGFEKDRSRDTATTATHVEESLDTDLLQWSRGALEGRCKFNHSHRRRRRRAKG